MKMLQTGDPCPICGQPIKTTDPNKLILLSAIGWFKEQNDCGTFDLCAAGDTGATNADKLRSLPEDALADNMVGLCANFGIQEHCQTSCTKCTQEWLAAPYTGWEYNT